MEINALSPLSCPVCHTPLHAELIEGKTPSAKSFPECRRRCEAHGIGFSNARQPGSETTIYRDARDNVPEPVREGFIEALSAGVNKLNRENKRQKATFSTSEDALTWTVFRGLQLEGALARVLSAVGVDIANEAKSEPALILWGAPVPPSPGIVPQPRLVGLLETISLQLGEVPERRTEPDVVLDFGVAGVVLVEVKYRSANDIKSSDYPNWIRYLQTPDSAAFVDSSAIPSNGHYELTRNWRFAWEVARSLHVPVALVNLGRRTLFDGEAGRGLRNFTSLIATDANHQFHSVKWEEVAGACGDLSTWLIQYITKRVRS